MTINNDAASMWDSDVGEDEGGGQKIKAGIHNAVITKSAVGPHPRWENVTSWNYSVKIDGSNFVVDGEVEISPMVAQKGGPGKVKFAKWQLKQVMGFDGHLSELATHAPSWIGTPVSVELKDFRGNGFLEPTLKAKVSPGNSTAGSSADLDQLANAVGGTVVDEEIVL